MHRNDKKSKNADILLMNKYVQERMKYVISFMVTVHRGISLVCNSEYHEVATGYDGIYHATNGS